MTVAFKPAHQKLGLSSQTLEKIIATHKNLSKSPPKLWNHREINKTLPNLTLAHPILTTLDSFPHFSTTQFNQIHTQLIILGLFQHPFAASRVVKKLCSSPITANHAVSIFDSIEEPDAFMCNTIVRMLVGMNDSYGGLKFYYENMVRKSIAPNHYSFPILVKACVDVGFVVEGEKMHTRIVKFGFELDLFVRNSLIRMYSCFGRIGDARVVFDASSELDLVSWNSMIDGYVKNGEVSVAHELFDEMPVRDVFSWNSVIAGYVGNGNMDAAKELFERMPCKDVVSWNCLIDGYARIGNVSMASDHFEMMPYRNVVSWNTVLALLARSKDCVGCLGLFDRMIEEREVNLNEATLVSVLTACANSGKLDIGKSIHSYIKINRKINPDVLLLTALLTMYAKCGAMDLAREVFEAMTERSVVSWNSMIMGYGIHGHGEKALEMFLEMEKSGPPPNDATFVCVLCACTHAGLVLEGWWYFDRMHRVYEIEPKVEHYGCMVDLLGRAGLMKDSEELIRMMPMEAGPALWGALLSACRTHSNVELGQVVAGRLIEMEPGDIGPYVLLSNIYAAEGKWDGVEDVRMMMKEKGLEKAVGFSSVHFAEFGLKSSIHKKSMVYSMLSEMGARMKLSCRD